MKNKFTTIGIILITVLLAGLAIFTAIRLYQTRSTPVAPNVPSSKPAAAGTECGGFTGKLCPAGEICVYSGSIGVCQAANTQLACQLNFVVTVATPTPTASPSPSPSPSPTPTRSPSPSPSPSPVPLCNSACTSSSNCPSGLACYIPNGATSGNCRKSTCNSETDCVCATPTPTASPSPSPSPTPTKSPSPTPTSTTTVTPTATATVTVSPNPLCNGACTANSNCPSGLMCYIASGATSGNCRNAQCLSETDCTCAVVTASPTAKPTYVAQVPTEEPTLPVVGTRWPTIFGAGFGILVIIGSLLLAL